MFEANDLLNKDFEDAKILIAIPHSGDMVPIDFCKSLMGLEKSKNTKIMWIGHTITSAARNILASYALKHGYEYVFYIDADMSLPKEALRLLWQHDLDIVCGMYMIRRGQETYIGHIWNEETERFNPVRFFDLSKTLNKIEAHGGGCLLIKSHVFDKISRPWFFYNDGCPENIEYVEQAATDDDSVIVESDDGTIELDMHLNSGYNMGEDFNFFKRVRDAKIEVYVDTTIRCGHISVYAKGSTEIAEYEEPEAIVF